MTFIDYMIFFSSRKKKTDSPLHWNWLRGVVSSSRSAMSGGPEQRAMPGSLYPAFTHWDNQRSSQSQYRGFAPRALDDRNQVLNFLWKHKSNEISVWFVSLVYFSLWVQRFIIKPTSSVTTDIPSTLLSIQQALYSSMGFFFSDSSFQWGNKELQ